VDEKKIIEAAKEAGVELEKISMFFHALEKDNRVSDLDEITCDELWIMITSALNP